MSTSITNYDGSIVTTPQQIARPTTVAELQNILRQTDKFPSPVRPMGSFHSLTPCAASPGTVVDMTKMKKVVKIDPQAMTFTAEAGLEMIEAARILREQKLQFLLNIEIGNLTLGSAACCHTKDSLDGVEFGQLSSYVTADQVGQSRGRAAGGVGDGKARAAAAHQVELWTGRASSTRSRSASSRSRSSSSTTRSSRPPT